MDDTRDTLLVLGGAYEFTKIDGQPPATPAAKLAAAYSYLNYDQMLLSTKEAAFFKTGKTSLPKNWSIADKVQTVVRNAGKIRVGLVLLPELPDGIAVPADALLSEIRNASTELKKKTDIVITLSPWGVDGERKLLEMRPAVVDILLGSGPGTGFAGAVLAEKKTVWARSYADGKAVQFIQLKGLPGKNRDSFAWERNKNVFYNALPLRDKTPSALEMYKIIQ